MSTLAERLRGLHASNDGMWPEFREAADRITALEAELSAVRALADQRMADLASVAAERDALKAALHPFVSYWESGEYLTIDGKETTRGRASEAAVAALQPSKMEERG